MVNKYQRKKHNKFMKTYILEKYQLWSEVNIVAYIIKHLQKLLMRVNVFLIKVDTLLLMVWRKLLLPKKEWQITLYIFFNKRRKLNILGFANFPYFYRGVFNLLKCERVEAKVSRFNTYETPVLFG